VTVPDARDWWLALEPVHAVVYFDEGCRRSMADLGLRGFWMGYFAGRAAPLGPVGPEVVGALFCNFAPEMVARAIPDAWAIADPGRVWDARRAGAAALLRTVAPGVTVTAERTVPALARAVGAASGAGRALFAATRATGCPDDPVEALWWACTCLREHRGDGHVAALAASGLDGIEALVLFAAGEGLPEGMFRSARGWSEDDWGDADRRLRSRGLLGPDGISPEGIRLRRSVEVATDLQAAFPFRTLGDRERREVFDALEPIGRAIHASGVIPYPNPMGLPEPSGG
jgi:hypothetical protein